MQAADDDGIRYTCTACLYGFNRQRVYPVPVPYCRPQSYYLHMTDRCLFLIDNGLFGEQATIINCIIDAISDGSNPVDSLRASEPLLSKLSKLQPQQPLLRPANQPRTMALAKLQDWVADNIPGSHSGSLWEFSSNGDSVHAKQHLDAGSE